MPNAMAKFHLDSVRFWITQAEEWAELAKYWVSHGDDYKAMECDTHYAESLARAMYHIVKCRKELKRK